MLPVLSLKVLSFVRQAGEDRRRVLMLGFVYAAGVLASATLEEGAEESRPSVQIGDPFAEKLLIEASLELIAGGLLEGLQDLGGAGLTCALSESVARAGMGARVDLDAK